MSTTRKFDTRGRSVKTKVLHWLSLALALLSGVLAIADKVHALPIIPSSWTPFWGVGLSTALGIRSIIPLLGDLLDDGKINDSWKP